jgi:hypothetical protein
MSHIRGVKVENRIIVPILPRNYGARTINTDLCLRALPRGGMSQRRAINQSPHSAAI